MHVDDLLRAIDFAVEAGDAVLAKFDDGELECRFQTVNGARRSRLRRLHMDDIGGTHDVANPATGAPLKRDTFDHAQPRSATAGIAPADVAAINPRFGPAHMRLPHASDRWARQWSETAAAFTTSMERRR